MMETTIRWYKPSEKLPDRSGYVFVLTNTGTLNDVYYSCENNNFTTSFSNQEIDIVYWASQDEIVAQLKEKTAD